MAKTKELLRSCVRTIRNRLEEIIDLYPGANLTIPKAFDIFGLSLINNEIELEDALDYTAMDGNNDNGIDGLYIDDHDKCVYFYQFKTKEKDFNPEKDTFGRECINDILNAKNFLNETRKGNIGSCNSELKKLIPKIKDRMDKGYSFIGRVAVNGSLTIPAQDAFNSARKDFKDSDYDLQKFEIDDIAKLILSDAVEGIQPPKSIHLSFVKNKFFYDKSDGVILGQVPTSEIREVLDKQKKDVTLFGYNYRYFLGTSYRIGNVNTKIKQTLEDDEKKEKFHMFNNGIRITCEKIKTTGSIHNNSFIIYKPQIVNGGQTSAVISQLKKLPKSVTVDLKIIEADDELSREIATGTNTQTAVEGWDFRANEKFQRYLLKSFSNFKPAWWYEIKRGEFETIIQPKKKLLQKYKFAPDSKKYQKIHPDNLSKAVLSFLGKPGDARIKRKDFPEEKGLYKEIFNVGLTPHEYLLYYLIFTRVDGKISLFKKNFAQAEKNEFQGEYENYRGKGFLRYCSYFIVASIGYCFEGHYKTKKIGVEKAKYFVENQDSLNKIIDELYSRIVKIVETFAKTREGTLAERNIDPEWSNYFKNNQSFTRITEQLDMNLPKNEIEHIFLKYSEKKVE